MDVRRLDRAGIALCALLPLVVEGLTLPPGLVVDGDAAELVLVAAHDGVAHAPGYPLWTALARTWLLPGIGPPAVALAALSTALLAVATVAVRSMLRSLGCGPAPATALALSMAFLPGIWRVAVRPEVYTLDLALCAGALALAWKPGPRAAFWAAVLATAAVFHRPTALPVLLPVGVLLRGRWSVSGVLFGTLTAGLGYAHLAWRAAHPGVWVPPELDEGWVAYLTGGVHNGGFTGARPPLSQLALAAKNTGLQGIVAALGVFCLPLLPRRLGGPMLTWAALVLAWLALWTVDDPEVFALPLSLLGTLGFGALLARLPRLRRTALWMGVPLVMAAMNGDAARLEDARRQHQRLQDVLNAVPDDALMVCGDWSWRTALVAARLDRGHGPQIAPPPTEAELVSAWLAPGHPVWLPEERRTVLTTGVLWTRDIELLLVLRDAGVPLRSGPTGFWQATSLQP